MSNESMASYVTDTPSDIAELLAEIKALEAKNGELENRINVLEFHLQEIADSDLVASNLRCMAKHALNNKKG